MILSDHKYVRVPTCGRGQHWCLGSNIDVENCRDSGDRVGDQTRVSGSEAEERPWHCQGCSSTFVLQFSLGNSCLPSVRESLSHESRKKGSCIKDFLLKIKQNWRNPKRQSPFTLSSGGSETSQQLRCIWASG